MKIEFDNADLAPLIERIVAETLRQNDDAQAKHNGTLALDEASASAACGIERHSLRDARRRGELTGTRLGRRICYEVSELKKWIEKNRCQTRTDL